MLSVWLYVCVVVFCCVFVGLGRVCVCVCLPGLVCFECACVCLCGCMFAGVCVVLCGRFVLGVFVVAFVCMGWFALSVLAFVVVVV